MKKIKIRKKVELKDLSTTDLQLLRGSYAVKPEEWFCFGYSFERLLELGLITEDNKISHYGKQLVVHLKGV